MSQIHANDIRSRLRLTASVLVIAAAATFTAADAQTVDVVGGSAYDTYSYTGQTLNIASGVTGVLLPNYDTWDVAATEAALQWQSPIMWTDTTPGAWDTRCLYANSCTTSAKITVASGGTLKIVNDWNWMELQDLITSYGTVEFVRGTGTALLGTNYFYGDVILNAGSINWGEAWIYSNNIFGTATNFLMGSGTSMTFNEPHTITNTINTIVSADNTASITFNNGTMIVNGQNTAASSYYGSVTINAGAIFAVGDETHSTAVFGDVTGSAATIAVNQSGGLVGTLKGYGTIYGTVANDGKVAPGGTGGTIGTLTINGDYTQSVLGQMVTEVTPTGASKLAVTGTAALNGSLVVHVDDGDYSTPVTYDVLTAGTVTGSFSTISVEGNAAFVGAYAVTNGYKVAVQSSSSAQSYAHQVTANRFAMVSFSRSLFDRLDTPSAEKGKGVAWIAPFGSTESLDRDGYGYSNNTYGVRLGVEYHMPVQNGVVGLAFSYGSGDMDMKGDSSTASSKTYTFAAYGGVDLLYARLDATAFATGFDTDITRSLGTIGSVKAKPEGSGYGASVQVSKSLFNDRITPYVAGYFSRAHMDGVTETGNDNFALAYNAIDKNFMAADLGVKVHLIKPSASGFKLDVNLAIEHDFSDRGEYATASFANITGSSVAYDWKGDGQNVIVAGVFVSKTVADKLDVFARVNGEFSQFKKAADFSIGAKYRL